MNPSTTSPNPTGSTHANPSDSAPIRSSSFRRPPSLEASAKKVTLFAGCLAIIEKIEHGFREIAFFWAMVVFVNYASVLKPIEFWFVYGIIILQGIRIFSRRSISSHPLPDYMLQRIWLPKYAQLLLVFVPKLLHWLQILAATVCVIFSLMRLGQQNFEEEALHNQKIVLVIFYIFVLVEAHLSLVEKCYWTWIIEHKKLFKQLMEELELGPNGSIFLHLFFNDAHSKCIDGNFFDGLKMNLITFAEKLIDANSLDDRIIGVEILDILKLRVGL